MRMYRFVIAMTVLFTLGVVTPVHAQFGWAKKVVEKVKSVRITTVSGEKNEGKSTDDGTTGETASTVNETSPTRSVQKVEPKKLKDGEAAVISTTLSENDTTAGVKGYFDSKDVDYTINPDTGRIISAWFGERRCGPGFYRCANRATVRVVAEEGKIVIRVQVMERKREGGINEKPWKDGTTSKGKETAQFAAELEAFLASNTVASR